LSLLGILPGLASSPPKGIEFEHGDWMLACDNTRTCRAAGYQKEAGDNLPVSILLTRLAGPRQTVTGKLMLGQFHEAERPSRLTLQINDTELGPLGYDADKGVAVFSATQVTALLATLTRNSHIVATGNDGKRWTVSDHGASAVLLKMDEFQGRIRTPGALTRKGSNAEDAVLPALPMPVVDLANVLPTRPADKALAGSPALRAALVATTSADDCEALHPTWSAMSNEGPQEMKVQRLSADKLLVSHLCWRGAYNRGDGYWVVNDRTPYQPSWVTYSGSSDTVRSIEEWHRGRGRADCIYSTTWGWTGTRFVKTSVTSSGLCRSIALGGPWNLPTLVTKVQQ
jgi:hypothetical protein